MDTAMAGGAAMTIKWLREQVPGFAGLPRGDYVEITRFFWLWSYFEFRYLGEDGNVPAITALTGRWRAHNNRIRDTFADSLAYFSGRYFPNGVESEHFQHLSFRNAEDEAFVRRVLGGADVGAREEGRAALIVVYRLRNNLFHGPKWQYDLAGQRLNFRHANRVLIAAMELGGERRR